MSKARIPDKLGATAVANAFFQFRVGKASIDRASAFRAITTTGAVAFMENRNEYPVFARRSETLSSPPHIPARLGLPPLCPSHCSGRVRPGHPPFEGVSI